MRRTLSLLFVSMFVPAVAGAQTRSDHAQR